MSVEQSTPWASIIVSLLNVVEIGFSKCSHGSIQQNSVVGTAINQADKGRPSSTWRAYGFEPYYGMHVHWVPNWWDWVVDENKVKFYTSKPILTPWLKVIFPKHFRCSKLRMIVALIRYTWKRVYYDVGLICFVVGYCEDVNEWQIRRDHWRCSLPVFFGTKW